MRILLADHHILFREGLIGLLTRDPEIKIIDITGQVRETIDKAVTLKPDILLLEMTLLDGSGIDVLKAVHTSCPEVNVVFLTMEMTDDLLLSSVENGAKGYLHKDIPIDQLILSLKGVMRNEIAFKRATMRRLVDRLARRNGIEPKRTDFDELTDREREVFELVCHGSSNMEIANTLSISENTVKAHVRKILEKLNVQNRREVRRHAIQQGYPFSNGIVSLPTSLSSSFRVKK